MTQTTVQSDLTPISTWSKNFASHLLRRTLTGPRIDEIDLATSEGLNTTLNKLLKPRTNVTKPIVINTEDTFDPVDVGNEWVGIYTPKPHKRLDSLWGWWASQLSSSDTSFEDLMVLFLHNHIPVQGDVVTNAQYYYDYLQILRKNAFGNLKTLVEEVSVSAAMLVYLNGDGSTAEAPNENFGRELLELFTLGKGPLKGAGDYTYYTEHDVQEASRCLTGWSVDSSNWSVKFTLANHDQDLKTFSKALGSQTILNQGQDSYKALIEILFQQQQVAKYFIRKLYRFFVHYHIDSDIESNIIEPLATLLKEGDWEIKPVLEKLLKSQHFYDQKITGGLIKNPISYVFGMHRALEGALTTPSVGYLGEYNAHNFLKLYATRTGWELAIPPSVAGFQAYYVAPIYHRLFVDSEYLISRQGFLEAYIKGLNRSEGSDNECSIKVNFSKINSAQSTPIVPAEIARYCANLLLPKSLPETVITNLADDYQNAKVGDGLDPKEERLKYLLKQICRMPEFNLC